MRYELFVRFLKISALCVWAFIFVSCSETVLNPEDVTNDPPVLGSPEPITFFNTIGEGDLQFNITSKVYYYSSLNYNVVEVYFANSGNTYEGVIALSPSYPTANKITFNLGHKVLIVEYIEMVPAFLNFPGELRIAGRYYSQWDELPFQLKISWYADGHK